MKNDSRTVGDRMALLAKLADEILASPDCLAEHISVVGEDAVRAVTKLSQLLRTDRGNMAGETNLSASVPATSVLSTIYPSHVLESISASSHLHRPRNLPQLPSIDDQNLSQLPFRHQGTLRSHESTSVNASYERLEFLGDAYLEIIASRLIYSRFPHLTAGRMSQVREALIKNETLAEYAVGYGFDKRARIPSSHQESGKLWIKTMGDIFEAYVAAVVLANPTSGFQTAEVWLTELWAPKLLQQHIAPKANPDAKQVLARRIMGKGIKVSYIDEKRPISYTDGKTYYHIGVYLTGWGWKNQHLGSGKGLNKVEAGTHAAMEALANTPLVDEIAAIKRAYDAQVKEERALESMLQLDTASD